MILTGIKNVNLLVAFLLELIALVAFGYWGFTAGPNGALRWLLGLGVPLLVAILWGIFLSPQANVKLPELLRVVLRVLVFASAAAALGVAGRPTLAWIFAVLVAINIALAYALGEERPWTAQ